MYVHLSVRSCSIYHKIYTRNLKRGVYKTPFNVKSTFVEYFQEIAMVAFFDGWWPWKQINFVDILSNLLRNWTLWNQIGASMNIEKKANSWYLFVEKTLCILNLAWDIKYENGIRKHAYYGWKSVKFFQKTNACEKFFKYLFFSKAMLNLHGLNWDKISWLLSHSQNATSLHFSDNVQDFLCKQTLFEKLYINQYFICLLNTPTIWGNNA